MMVIIPLNFARCTLPTHRNRLVKSSLYRVKHDDVSSTTWWSVLSTDKCCQVTDLLIERTDHHVLLKASSCLRSLTKSYDVVLMIVIALERLFLRLSIS